MKQFLFLLAAIFILNTSAFTQNTVKLNIKHKLGAAPFALNTGAQNNLGDDFNISSLRYYLSKFTIVHDGGTETSVNTYALVDASTSTTIDLGAHNINTVEAIRFHTGVDSATNHLDPSLYDPTHPLAPKSPTMHWGWSGGYRFATLEGQGSSSYNQDMQVHALGDENYFEATVATGAVLASNEITITIDADYTRALENISVNAGLVLHGFGGAAQVMLQNFSQYVFSPTTTSTIDFSEVNSFKVFPNPTAGKATIALEATEDLTYQIRITDILGKEVTFINTLKSNQLIETELNQAGLYFVQLIKNGQTVMTKKLLVSF